MTKINKHIEILRTSTSGLSSMGLKSCEMICQLLQNHFQEVGISQVNSKHDLAALVAKKPDLVFVGFKNIPGSNDHSKRHSNIWIAEYLDDNQINYTGSNKLAMTLDHNKVAAKKIITDAGILTAPYFTAQPGQYRSAGALPLKFPLFIKPPKLGGGKGIDDDSIVRDFMSYERKVLKIEQNYGTVALVEKYLMGREFSVALLDSKYQDSPIAMPIELLTQPNDLGDRVLSSKIKTEDSEQVRPVSPGPVRNEIIDFAKAAYKALGARDYGRIDIRMDEHDRLYFLEANLIPGVANHDFTSYFTSACKINQNMDYESMIMHIINLGLSRQLQKTEVLDDLLIDTLEPVIYTV